MFDWLLKSHRPAQPSSGPATPAASQVQTQQPVVIHNHIAHPLGDVSNSPLKKAPKRKKEDPDSDSDDSDDFGAVYPPIIDILNGLHAVYPAFDYPDYALRLASRGIHYANNAAEFDWKYYQELGMADRAIKSFLSSSRRR